MTIFIKVGNSICVKALNQIHLSQLFSDLEAEKADVFYHSYTCSLGQGPMLSCFTLRAQIGQFLAVKKLPDEETVTQMAF